MNSFYKCLVNAWHKGLNHLPTIKKEVVVEPDLKFEERVLDPSILGRSGELIQQIEWRGLKGEIHCVRFIHCPITGKVALDEYENGHIVNDANWDWDDELKEA